MASKSIIKVRILGDNKDFKGALGDSESAAGKWAGKLAGIVKNGAIAAGVTAAAGLAKGFTDALDAQSNDALIASRLGVDPDRAGELGDIAAAAYRDAWGDSLGDVTNVVTGLETSFENLGGDQLERLTGQAIALGDAFEVDAAQGIQTASELVSSGLADSADEAFDLLTRGLQEMPQGIRDELFAASNEYGDFFADLGISGDVAFAKLTEYAEDGVYGIDKFGDALKELTIRGTDMSDASIVAYERAGLSAEEMSARFIAGGEQARTALEDTAAGLLSIEDPVERANAAIALFGTPIEDLSVSEIPAFLEGLTDMGSGMGDVEGAAADMAGKLAGTNSAKIEKFKRKALGALADFAAKELIPRFEQAAAWFEQNWPEIRRTGEETFAAISDAWSRYGAPTLQTMISVGQSVVGWVRENWPTIRSTIEQVMAAVSVAVGATVAWLRDEAWPIVQQVVEFVRTEFDNLVGWVRENWPKIRETIDGVIQAVKVIIETTIDVISRLWEQWGDHILSILETTWETAKSVVQAAIDVVRGIIDTVTSLIRGDWDGVWEGIKTALSGVWDGMVAIVSGALGVIGELIEAAWGTVDQYFSDTWNGIKGFFSDTWDAITGFVSEGVSSIVGFVAALPGEIADVAAGAFDSLWQSFRDVINRIIGGWNGLEFRIPGFDPPGPGPKFGGFTLGVPNIPYLASGHVATSPMVAMIGEYAGARQNPEIVAPRSEMISAVREAMAEASPSQPFTGPVRLVIGRHEFDAYLDDRERELAGAA